MATFVQQQKMWLNLCGTILAPILMMLCALFLPRQQRKERIWSIKSKSRPQSVLKNSQSNLVKILDCWFLNIIMSAAASSVCAYCINQSVAFCKGGVCSSLLFVHLVVDVTALRCCMLFYQRLCFWQSWLGCGLVLGVTWFIARSFLPVFRDHCVSVITHVNVQSHCCGCLCVALVFIFLSHNDSGL